MESSQTDGTNFVCPLCRMRCVGSSDYRTGIINVECERCGKYPVAPRHGSFPLQVPRVPEFLLEAGVDAHDVQEASRLLGAYLSMYTRVCTESRRPPELVNLVNPNALERLAKTVAFKPRAHKADALLRLLQKRAPVPGHSATFDLALDYPAIYTLDSSEARFHVKDLMRKKLVDAIAEGIPGNFDEKIPSDFEGKVGVTLTPVGWERLETAVHALATSRLTSKSQITIPAAVRTKLNLSSGDTVIFEESESGTVYIRKSEPFDTEFLSALEGTLSEWNSEHDNKAYGDL